MPFQSTVFLQMAFGVQGEVYSDSPWTAQPYTINSGGNPQYNIIGATACTVVSQQVCTPGGTGAFAGFLIAAKNNVSFGTQAGGPLAPTMTLADQQPCQCLTMGIINVLLPAACNIGDYVLFNTTTGALSTVPPGTTLPGGTAFAQAIVSNFTPNAVGSQIATITVNPTYTNP
jgi:hypothetical protein